MPHTPKATLEAYSFVIGWQFRAAIRSRAMRVFDAGGTLLDLELDVLGALQFHKRNYQHLFLTYELNISDKLLHFARRVFVAIQHMKGIQ